MLQKPKTKFGYARRIFALPVLFTVAFAYMVNAKNKEIKETNIAIEKAVSQIKDAPEVTIQNASQIKKDTLTPNNKSTIDGLQQKEVRKKENEKLKDLGKKIQEKGEALRGLKPESKEFKKNVEELSALSAEMGKITSSDDFRMAYMVNGNEMKRVNDFFNSAEWKDKVKELENMRFEIPEIPEINFDFPDVPVPPNAPSAPRMKTFKFKEMKDMKWAPDGTSTARMSEKNVKEMEAKRAKLDKKRARLNEKRAKLEGERAKLEVERRALEGNNRKVYIYSSNSTFNDSNTPNTPVSIRLNSNFKDATFTIPKMTTSNQNYDNLKLYVNGVEVSKKEFEAVNPGDIKSVNVYKRTKDGSPSGEIRVQTK